MVKKINWLNRNFFISVLFCLCAAFVSAQDVKVNAYTDTTDYLIGDHIKYTIQVTAPKDAAILATGFRDSIKNVDVISIDDPKKEEKENFTITRYTFTLSRFDSAEVTIPPVPVYYRKNALPEGEKAPMFMPEQAATDPSIITVFANPVTFSIRAVKVNIEEDIKDVKDPVTLPPDWKIIALWVLGGLILLGALFFIYWKYIRKKDVLPKKKIIILPPHAVALNSLKELEEKKLWQNGRVKDYHSEITEIIRKYFEERFKFHALELTTSEAMFHLRNTTGAEPITDLTYNFLSNADLVKFAKYTPMNTVNEEMMKQAYEIVNLTIPVRIIQPAKEETNV